MTHSMQARFHQLAQGFAECISPLVPSGPVALLAFPHHPNVGDSAIWLGERRWLRSRTDLSLRYAASSDRYDQRELRRAMPHGTILFHGGGNFGDIWPGEQQHREQVLEDLRDYRIVQLPQTIHFASATNAAQVRRLIAQHGDVVITVRDQPSHDWGRANLDCDVQLVPDAAFMLGVQRTPAPTRNIAYLVRTDCESTGALADVQRDDNDWMIDYPWVDHPQAIAMNWRAMGRSGLRGRIGIHWMDFLARTRLRRGLQQLARGRVVVTDRLHAAILARRIERPAVVMDNNYGKVSSVLAKWLPNDPGLMIAATTDSLREHVATALSLETA